MNVITPLDGDERAGFYVTMQRQFREGTRTAYLLGPYATHAEADSRKRDGRRLAEQVDSRAVWDAYGITRLVMQPGADLPAGKLNHLLKQDT